MKYWRRVRTSNQGNPNAETPGDQVWSLALLGAILGAILGWLTGSGALPHPDFLPIPSNAILITTLACAAIGTLISGLLGLLADLSDRQQAADTVTDKGTTGP